MVLGLAEFVDRPQATLTRAPYQRQRAVIHFSAVGALLQRRPA